MNKNFLIFIFISFIVFNSFGDTLKNTLEYTINSQRSPNIDLSMKHELIYFKSLSDNSLLDIKSELILKKGESDINFYRFLYEKYYQDLRIKLGRQTTLEGHSLLFNYVDIFSYKDVSDPYSEVLGKDLIRVTYNKNAFSKIDFIYEVNNKNATLFRYSDLIDNLDYSINFSEYKMGLIKVNDAVIDFKFDAGIGVWGSYVWRESKIDDELYTLGMDYSFSDNDNTLICTAEYSKDINLDISYIFYNLRYSFDFDHNISINFLQKVNGSREYFGVEKSKIISDNRSMKYGFKRYYSNSVPGNLTVNPSREIYLNLINQY